MRSPAFQATCNLAPTQWPSLSDGGKDLNEEQKESQPWTKMRSVALEPAWPCPADPVLLTMEISVFPSQTKKARRKAHTGIQQLPH